MEPFSSLFSNGFQDSMLVVSKWHGEKTKEIKVNSRRKILNTITYPKKEFQVRSTILSH
jgi:hypothetical protein